MLQSYGYIIIIAEMMDNGLRRWHFPKTFLYSMYKKLFFTDSQGHSACNNGQEEKWEKCFTYESCQMLQL
jgi:hypothetical protein